MTPSQTPLRTPTSTRTCLTLAAALAASVIGFTSWQAMAQEGEQATTQPATQPAATQPAAPEPTAPAETAAEAPVAQPAEAQAVTTESGLQYRITKPSQGPRTAQEGDVVMVHYTGQLEDGSVFDTSLRPRPVARGRMLVQPFVFPLGEGWVIQGWDEGIVGMKVGEKRQLTIPPDLAYGERGAPPAIPANATLIFDVELVGLWRPEEEAQAE